SLLDHRPEIAGPRRTDLHALALLRVDAPVRIEEADVHAGLGALPAVPPEQDRTIRAAGDQLRALRAHGLGREVAGRADHASGRIEQRAVDMIPILRLVIVRPRDEHALRGREDRGTQRAHVPGRARMRERDRLAWSRRFLAG